MKETRRRLMVMDRFRFVGWVPYDRVPGFLSIADMVVQPLESEGLSRVYREAMACGRTLISVVANNSALRERIGRSASTRVATHALERMAAEYDRVFREIVVSP